LKQDPRHVLAKDPTAEQRFASLRRGELLAYVDEPDNPWNKRAILVTASGWAGFQTCCSITSTQFGIGVRHLWLLSM
jgi:hypothetical protein